jgi:hypothetical protein
LIEIDVLWLEPKEKNCMWFDAPVDTFQPPKNGLYMKIGTLLEDQNQVGSLYWKDNIVFIV